MAKALNQSAAATATATATTNAKERLQRLVIADGSLEALKWLGMVLMALDHVNKYLLHESIPTLFYLGRLVMPVFGFVLMYNLARPDAVSSGMHRRVAFRLLAFGTLATTPFIALVGWWPLNILFMLLLATVIVWLVELGGMTRLTFAVVAFILGGALVEFWWFGLLACLGARAYCLRPSTSALALWTLALASLWVVNQNFAALAALPLVLLATQLHIPSARHRWIFYSFYPAHLAVIWGLQRYGLQIG